MGENSQRLSISRRGKSGDDDRGSRNFRAGHFGFCLSANQLNAERARANGIRRRVGSLSI